MGDGGGENLTSVSFKDFLNWFLIPTPASTAYHDNDHQASAPDTKVELRNLMIQVNMTQLIILL